MTLDQWSEHFRHIYGRNNAVYITSLQERLGLLVVAVRSLQDAIRKKRSEKKQARALAHVLAWTYAVVDHFRFPSLAYYLCLKYPAERCGYCHAKPCSCLSEKRAQHTANHVTRRQLAWSIKDWQKHLDELYGQNNRERGVADTFDRLFTEIAEVHHILAGSSIGRTAQEIEREYGMEIADVTAWVFAVSIILNVDLEKGVRALYKRGCPYCKGNPCGCRKFAVVHGRITHVPTIHLVQ